MIFNVFLQLLLQTFCMEINSMSSNKKKVWMFFFSFWTLCQALDKLCLLDNDHKYIYDHIIRWVRLERNVKYAGQYVSRSRVSNKWAIASFTFFLEHRWLAETELPSLATYNLVIRSFSAYGLIGKVRLEYYHKCSNTCGSHIEGRSGGQGYFCNTRLLTTFFRVHLCSFNTFL